MSKTLMKGNEALAFAAIEAGCSHFFGYPITPQNEIPEYLARELPKTGGIFLQAESEVAAINMVYGAAACGGRPMTSSSSPGIALMQEGISLLAAAELPCVIVNVQRGGPGIGTIQPSQADYFQMTRGGGNGDYRVVSLAPTTVQEGAEMMLTAFDLADRYRMPVFILSDGMLGQMMEPVDLKSPEPKKPTRKSWAITGHNNKRAAILVKTLCLDPAVLEKKNLELQKKYTQVAELVANYENYFTDDAEIVLTAYGSAARIAKNSVDSLRQKGIPAGLLIPKTLWPFPAAGFHKLSDQCKKVLCVEMSCGQMVDDVRLAVNGRFPVHFFGRCGGMIPTPEEIAIEAQSKFERA